MLVLLIFLYLALNGEQTSTDEEQTGSNPKVYAQPVPPSSSDVGDDYVIWYFAQALAKDDKIRIAGMDDIVYNGVGDQKTSDSDFVFTLNATSLHVKAQLSMKGDSIQDTFGASLSILYQQKPIKNKG
jgi:hypothetical protein